jgi:hypothetical protein
LDTLKSGFSVKRISYRAGGKWFAMQMNAPAFKNRDVARDAVPFIRHPQVANARFLILT